MRSAVAGILSGEGTEQNMSYPDYEQTPHDHQSLLIVVRHIGQQLRTKQFNRAFERISRLCSLKLLDSQNNPRSIWIRYLRNYPVENNDWGDFQTHRKALGLLTIGQCNSQEELSELCRIHESLKVKYSWTLIDSRCILFGLNEDGTLYDGSHSSDGSPADDGTGAHETASITGSITSSTQSTSGYVLTRKQTSSDSESLGENSIANDDGGDTISESSKSESAPDHPINYTTIPESDQEKNASLITPNNFKARTLFYPTMDSSGSLEADIEEFTSALFWVLESKRLDKLGLRKADRSLLLSALCAPFEKKDFVGLDLDSKNNKRRADGRLKKQLGDLSLQAGLPSEAIAHYQGAAEILKSVNDWLWLAGALEGQCAASVSTIYPQLRRTETLHRNASLQGNELTRSRVPPPPDLETTKKTPIKNCLSKAEILEKYKESVNHYGKYRQAGIIETEASIKAALVLIEQDQTLAAAEFLQNAVFISLQLNEEEKMTRFNSLSELYSKLGFHRKAAFFKRVAAMRCVSPSNPQPNWGLCHSLLFSTLSGYKLSLDPNESSMNFYGWPRLQMQVLQELVGTAKRRGNSPLATRHMTLLLHLMLPHLSREERRDFAIQLEVLTKEAEGVPMPLCLDSGFIIPPVHLSHLPLVKVFKLIQPPPTLRPEKTLDKPIEDASPFVYTPFNLHRDRGVKDVSKADFSWVQGETCEISLVLENPLPIELKVSSLSLLTEGVKFQVNSNVLSIPPESSMPTILTGTPLGPGELRIIGYSLTALGVHSKIKLKNLEHFPFPHIDVQIVPSLPSLAVETSYPKSEFFSSFSDAIITSASACLLMGETQECTVTLVNNGSTPVETLELVLDSRMDSKRAQEIFQWDKESILGKLPLPPGDSINFIITLFGAGDFIGQPDPVYGPGGDNSSLNSFNTGNTTAPPSLIVDGGGGGPSSLPSRLGAALQRAKRTESLISTRSSTKSASSGGSTVGSTVRTQNPITNSNIKNYEALLKIKYSGGPGLESKHFRNCSIAFNVEVTPSLLITKWDTLPGESASQFYLVLDVYNSALNEMEVNYANVKQILIEKNETCRIPIPIEKCPIDTLEKGSEEAICCQHIISQVNLKWVLPECEGKATLEGIHLTSAMTQLVTVSPIQWEIMINGESVKNEEIRFTPGEMINVDVWLRNHLKEELDNVILSLECFQDFQNGKPNYRLDSRFAVIGNDSILIPKIASGDSYQHSLSIIFFVGGFYKIDFKCNNNKGKGEAGGVEQPPQVPQTTFQPHYGTSVRATLSPTPALEEMVWKYNPPIEFQIIDSY